MRLILLAFTILSTTVMAQERIAPIELRGNVSVASEYVFRGIAMSDEDIVLQGGLDLIMPWGFYAGAWASGVDTPWGGVYNQVPGVEDFEYDLYAGWQWGNSDNRFRVDTGVIQYAFSDDPADLTWSEYYLGVTLYRQLRMKVSTQLSGLDFGTYYEASWRRPLPHEFDVTLHAGHFDVEDRQVRDINQYTDFAVTLGRSYKGFRFDLSYHRTDRDGRVRYLGAADDRVVFSIGRDFELYPNFRAFEFR